MLKQKFATQFGTNILVKIMTMAAGIFVARLAGPSVLGTLSYGLAFVSIWGFINAVFAPAHMKLVSEGQNSGDCVTTYSVLKGFTTIIYVLVVLGWLFIQLNIGNQNLKDNTQIQVIFLSLGVMFLTQFPQIVSSSYAAMLLQAKANIPNLIKTFIFHLGRVVLVVLGAKAFGLSLWNLISLVIVLPLFIKYYRELPQGRFNKILAMKYIKYGFPIFLLSIVESFMAFSDKLILAHYSDIAELGYYAAAMSVGGSFLLLSNTIGTIFFPLFSQLIGQNNWKMVNRKNQQYQSFNSLFILPLILIVAIIAEPLLITVLGIKYQNSVSPFSIIVVSTYIVIVGMPYGNIINAMGRFYLNVWVNLSQLVVFLISVTFFVSPKHMNLGATGLALNLMIMYIYKNTVYIIISNKIGKLKYDFKNFLKVITILFISLIFFIISVYVKTFPLWWIIIVPIYYLVVYAFLYLTKQFSRSDINTLLEIINVKKTSKYIKDELSNK